MAQLKRKRSTRSINVRVDEDLYKRIQAVRQKAHHLGLEWDTSDVCRRALERAVTTAEKEIQNETGASWTARDQQLDL